VAIGAVSRLEVDGTPPEVTERFKSALRSSLGSLGDRLVWTAWRPASLLLGVLLLLAGAAWWLAVLAFLLVYNAFHVGLRVWGLRRGVDNGLEVGKVLRSAPLEAVIAWTGNAGALFCGAALILAIGPSGGELVSIASGLAAAAFGLWLGLSSRRVLAPALGLAWIFAIVWGMIP
jgi:PTS system mannose-specific IID component